MSKPSISLTGILIANIVLALWGCEGGGNTPPGLRIIVTLAPSAASVRVNRSIQFTATVRNALNTRVTWSVSGTGCNGAGCGMISDTGLYTAPVSVPSPATVMVKATSAADTSSFASATITILPAIVVTVSPSDPTIAIDSTQQFTATVENAQDSGVTWSVSGSGCTGNECGTITTTGLYTAPSAVPAAPAVSITATSVEDTAVSGSATATITSFVSVEWTWVSGSDAGGQAGSYGTKGIPAPSNVPGTRGYAVSWIDSQGKLWLFGGVGIDSAGQNRDLNDLWKYDPATLEWTWVSGSDAGGQAGTYGTKGIPAPSNVPGARYEAVSWIDSQDKLWLFGGIGLDSAGGGNLLNDLWIYDPTANEWTWVSGSDIGGQEGTYGIKGTPAPSNVPGARYEAVSWIDSQDKLWLFGGNALNFGLANDLWKYDPETLEWTWVSGSDAGGQAGTYGTKGIPAPSNVPGGRNRAVSWIDSQGNLWLFGGMGFDSAYKQYYLNDLWKYNLTTLEWAWVSGSDTGGQAGSYGTKGAPAPSNVPGARANAISLIDSQGNLWLFGGYNWDSLTGGYWNDLWKYNPINQEWTWVSGSDSVDQWGNYGTKGTPAPLNVPGAREGAVSWIDSQGNLWLFGGLGLGSNSYGWLNDLWHGIR